MTLALARYYLINNQRLMKNAFPPAPLPLINSVFTGMGRFSRRRTRNQSSYLRALGQNPINLQGLGVAIRL